MERQLTELITGLLKHGYRVTVISRRCQLSEHPALRWIRVPVPEKPFLLGYSLFFIVGTLQVWRHRVGLLHTMGAIVWNHADLVTVQYCHHGAAPKGGTSWGAPNVLRRVSSRLSASLSRLAERWIYRPAMVRHFAVVSTGVAREMHRNFPSIATNMTLIPNAVDQQIFRPDPVARRQVREAYELSDSDFVVLFVGGDWERKGLSVAIEAVAALQGCHLVVVGSGNANGLVGRVRSLAAKDRIHFAGPRTQTAPYFASADAFLLPTAYEAFPLVVCEAAASGLPLLVTKVNGVEEILKDGENGWFIKRDARQITLRLAALQADKRLRKSMGARSREKVARYSWSRVGDDYRSLYRELATGIADQPLVRDSLAVSLSR